jgi:hypothetical protein
MLALLASPWKNAPSIATQQIEIAHQHHEVSVRSL